MHNPYQFNERGKLGEMERLVVLISDECVGLRTGLLSINVPVAIEIGFFFGQKVTKLHSKLISAMFYFTCCFK